MSFATGTATVAEVVALSAACTKVVRAAQEICSGECLPNVPKRNTPAEMDSLVSAVTSAITAINA